MVQPSCLQPLFQKPNLLGLRWFMSADFLVDGSPGFADSALTPLLPLEQFTMSFQMSSGNESARTKVSTAESSSVQVALVRNQLLARLNV